MKFSYYNVTKNLFIIIANIEGCAAIMAENSDFNISIGNRIRLIREAQKKTREQVAEAADISAQFLFYIETGRKSMTAKTIVNLAKALNVTTDFILLGSVTPMAKIVNDLEGLLPEDLNLAEQFIKKFSEGAMNAYK